LSKMGRWWSVIHHRLIMFSSITFLHPERLWMAGLWLAVLLVVLLVGYRNLALSGWRKGAALGCKTLLALLLALCVLDPVQLAETVKQGANEVIVLVDNSASLNMAEKPGSPTRGEAVKAALAPDGKAWPAWMEELRKTFRVRLQSVDERVRAIGDASSLDFTGGQSSLASAVMTARDRRASSVAAVVLISDGHATDASGVNSGRQGSSRARVPGASRRGRACRRSFAGGAEFAADHLRGLARVHHGQGHAVGF